MALDRRSDGRRFDELRPVRIRRRFLDTAEGSVFIELGGTKVLCTATAEEGVPSFLEGTGSGWVTAEYSMLPRASTRRIPREAARGRIGGRTHEIQRLIGRSLRAVCDLNALDGMTIIVDCDVIQADGGTRTTSVTGACLAIEDLFNSLVASGRLIQTPLTDTVAAVSVGIVEGTNLLDLTYEEDSTADVDMNVVMTGSGRFVEVQGTAEARAFSREEMDGLIDLAEKGIRQLIAARKDSSSAIV